MVKSKYRCPLCKKETTREGIKQWIKSYCSEIGKMTRLIKIK